MTKEKIIKLKQKNLEDYIYERKPYLQQNLNHIKTLIRQEKFKDAKDLTRAIFRALNNIITEINNVKKEIKYVN